MNLDHSYCLAPGVSIRPERFGALLYNYHKRQLYFLYDQPLIDFVTVLDGQQPLGVALDGFLEQRNFTLESKPVFVRALEKLQAMEVLREL